MINHYNRLDDLLVRLCKFSHKQYLKYYNGAGAEHFDKLEARH